MTRNLNPIIPNIQFKVEIQDAWYSPEQCRKNSNKLYVYGDNLKRVGKGGQAAIRDSFNSYGIATKRLPTMDVNAFFSDQPDEARALYEDIYNLLVTFRKFDDAFDTIVLPADGLGTGLSQMPVKSPILFNWMNDTLSLILDVDFHPK